ncbi:MAG: hypothetical protein WA993_03505 [Candidatus Binatus sp.]|uniref:hypothetical protein n=1 Tax=Candidatus Binatus sp. TaxID=2811406 RepID=UPI003C8FCB18
MDHDHFGERPTFAHSGNDRRQIVWNPALPLKLAAEPFGIVNQRVALLVELIETAQIPATIDFGYQCTAFRYRLCGSLVCCRESFSAGKEDYDATSLTLRLGQLDAAVAAHIECVSR